jgi:glycine/D-amino acid oxidase-like deaminating enzyme
LSKDSKNTFDEVILGGGFFGLYLARARLRQGKNIALIEIEKGFFTRASFINQARIHLGYHYPRSLGTALQALEYFEKFTAEFSPAINAHFKKIYAISNRNSYTSSRQFQHFAHYLGIQADAVPVGNYFQKGCVEEAFLTAEPSFDAPAVLRQILSEIENHPAFRPYLSQKVEKVENLGDSFDLTLTSGEKIRTASVVNATYASINQVLKTFGFPPLALKYELAEVVLGQVSAPYKDLGITVMDGPFFSMMPFGNSGEHSLTAVEYTPHRTSRKSLPEFSCQNPARNGCSPELLQNCDLCPDQPESSFAYMYQLTKRYLKDDFYFHKTASRFAMKTILQQTEVDDSRPTLIQTLSQKPRFSTVLSGKINTVYELERLDT